MADPLPTFTYLISSIRERHPDFAYLHMVEPRIDGSQDRSIEPSPVDSLDSLDFARDIWQPKPFIAAGGYTAESAKARAEETGDIIAMGRYFISNVSLVPTSSRCDRCLADDESIPA
jgi:NADPH2 dehydrogenase